MFGIGGDLLQPKGNIIAPIVFIPAEKTKQTHLKIGEVYVASDCPVHVEGDPWSRSTTHHIVRGNPHRRLYHHSIWRLPMRKDYRRLLHQYHIEDYSLCGSLLDILILGTVLYLVVLISHFNY